MDQRRLVDEAAATLQIFDDVFVSVLDMQASVVLDLCREVAALVHGTDQLAVFGDDAVGLTDSVVILEEKR